MAKIAAPIFLGRLSEPKKRCRRADLPGLECLPPGSRAESSSALGRPIACPPRTQDVSADVAGHGSTLCRNRPASKCPHSAHPRAHRTSPGWRSSGAVDPFLGAVGELLALPHRQL